MSYPSYPEYKESEAEWLGVIPSHWGLRRLKYCLEPVREKTAVLSYPVALEHIESSSGALVDAEVEYAGEGIRFEPGDILFGKLRPYLAKVYRARAHGQAVGDFHVMRPVAEIDPGYAENQVRSEGFISVADGATYGAKMPRVGWESMANMLFAVPPKYEQTQIARFLDHQTARIDALIAEQQRLIELLKEKRQAVISHAVTKGLDPDVAMKHSGVEWLGDIPEHWLCMSYRYATRIFRGKFGHRPRNDPSLYDGDFAFIQTGDIAQADREISEYKQTLNEKGASVSQLFPAGTLVMAIAANIGDTAILGFEAYAPDSVVGFKPRSDISLDFLKYSLDASIQEMEKTATQSTQANLNIDRVGSVKGAFPPLEEQSAIISYLDGITAKYDQLEEEAYRSIGIMTERRSALISAAVTGKIDVRDWEPPVSEALPKSTASEEAPA